MCESVVMLTDYTIHYILLIIHNYRCISHLYKVKITQLDPLDGRLSTSVAGVLFTISRWRKNAKDCSL